MMGLSLVHGEGRNSLKLPKPSKDIWPDLQQSGQGKPVPAERHKIKSWSK